MRPTPKTFALAASAAFLTITAATQGQTQPTTAELLQKGIYAQETVGDLDGAVKIYRQIVDSHPTQREIAAQAQYRLGLTLLQKGDATTAAQEIQRLAWDFPDYKDLISSAMSARGAAPARTIIFRSMGAGPQQATIQFIAGTQQPHDAEFDFTKSVTVTGTVEQVQILNPYSWLTVNPVSVSGPMPLQPPIRVSLDSPSTLARAGWSKNTVNAGDPVTIIGVPALDGSSAIQATSVSANGRVLFSRSGVSAK
jgi:hypothetical protein